MTITDKQIQAAQDAYRKHVAEHGVEGSAEAMRAALEAADAAAWEPIETAPTDGTPVAIDDGCGVIVASFYAVGSLEDARITFGQDFTEKEYAEWAEDESELVGWHFAEPGPDGSVGILETPKRWRPIPTPPKGE